MDRLYGVDAAISSFEETPSGKSSRTMMRGSAQQACVRFFTGKRTRGRHQGRDQETSKHSQAHQAIFRQD
jgi:hypothetical protein